MRIDNKAMRRSEVLQINAVIDKIWSETVVLHDKESFIQESHGPDAIEMLNSGDDWIVCDRNDDKSFFWPDGRVAYIACHELFEVCAKFSPLPRIKVETID